MTTATAVAAHRAEFFKLVEGVRCSRGRDLLKLAPWIDLAIDTLADVKAARGRMYIIGNGASCSMASHIAVDFTKGAGIPTSACNEGALLTCFSNDFSYEVAYAEILRCVMNDGDALIAISSSGQSANILNATRLVKDAYARSAVITFSGFAEDNPLRRSGDLNLYLAAGEYGLVESGHAYYLHMLLDLFVERERTRDG